MAETAGLVSPLVLVAREAGAMRVPSRSTDPVAPDAELLACAPVARRAGDRIQSRLASVISASSPRIEPARRVRVATRWAEPHARRRVAFLAGALAVAGDAEARIDARFLGVAAAKTGSVQAYRSAIAHGEPGREPGGRPDAVAGRAGALAVAGRAEIASARRADPVLPQKIAIVNDVAARRDPFGREIFVAPVAVSNAPLILVRVAGEADAHGRAQRLGAIHGDLLVAPDAVAVDARHVVAMLEAQVFPGHRRAGAHVGFPVATAASAGVVGFLVAAKAILIGRKMERSGLIGEPDGAVALPTIDALEYVRSVLEGMRRIGPNSQDPRAGREGEDQRERCGGSLQGVLLPQRRVRRASAVIS